MNRTVRSVVVLLLLILAIGAHAQQNARDEAAIRVLEQRWDEANLKGDSAALDAILADGFIFTGDDGIVHTKAEVLAELSSRNIAYQSAQTDELRIILHGDAAVVSGRWRGSYQKKATPIHLRERFTNFYVRRGGRWQCVASHGSAIEESKAK